jgi:hypothetical protein
VISLASHYHDDVDPVNREGNVSNDTSEADAQRERDDEDQRANDEDDEEEELRRKEAVEDDDDIQSDDLLPSRSPVLEIFFI